MSLLSLHQGCKNLSCGGLYEGVPLQCKTADQCNEQSWGVVYVSGCYLLNYSQHGVHTHLMAQSIIRCRVQNGAQTTDFIALPAIDPPGVTDRCSYYSTSREVVAQHLSVLVFPNCRDEEWRSSKAGHALGNVPPNSTKGGAQRTNIGSFTLAKGKDKMPQSIIIVSSL